MRVNSFFTKKSDVILSSRGVIITIEHGFSRYLLKNNKINGMFYTKSGLLVDMLSTNVVNKIVTITM